MQAFYEKTQGVTLLVIKHQGKKFDYANGRADNLYFPSWSAFIPFMDVGKCYVIACTVKEGKHGNAQFYPFGIVHECFDDREARDISKSHMDDVLSGRWDARREYGPLCTDWQRFQKTILERRVAAVEKETEKAKHQLLQF